MKFAMRFVATMLIALLAVSSSAGDGPGKGCKPLGSWLGYDEDGSVWWMTTTDGQNASHGTLNLEVPGSTIFFPGAAGVTEMRGVWEKTGDYDVAWTVVGFAYDTDEVTVALARLSGKSKLSWDCNTERLTDVFLEVYLPDANVDVDEPEWTMAFPDHDGYRIKLVTYDLP